MKPFLLAAAAGLVLVCAADASAQAAKVYVKFPATGLTAAEQTTIFNRVKAQYAFLGADISFSTMQAGTNQTVCLENTFAPGNRYWGTSSKRNKSCTTHLKEFTADPAVTGKLTRAQQLTAAADTMAHELAHNLCATHNWNAPASRSAKDDTGTVATGNGNATDLMTNGGKVSLTERGAGRSLNAASQNQIKNGIKMLKAGKGWDLKVPDSKSLALIEGAEGTFFYEDDLDPTELFKTPLDIDIFAQMSDGNAGFIPFLDMGFISDEDLFVPVITDDLYDPNGFWGYMLFEPGEAPTFAIGGSEGGPFDGQFFEPMPLLEFGQFGDILPPQLAQDQFLVPDGYARQAVLAFDLDGDDQPDVQMQLATNLFAVTHGFLPYELLPQPFCIADVTTINTNPGDPDYGLPDGSVDGADLSFFVEAWLAQQPIADVTTINTNPGDPQYGVPDGSVDGADLSFFVEAWLAGCP